MEKYLVCSSLVDIWKCIRRRAHWAKSKWVFVEEGGLGNVAKCNVGWGLEGGRGEINWWACFELLPLLHSSCVWIWLTHRRGAHQLSPARAQQFLDTSLETAFPDLAASTEWFSNILFLEFKVVDVITHLCPVWLIFTHIRCHYRCVWRNPYRPPGQCWESFEEVQIHLGIKELLQERNEVMDCIHSTAVWVLYPSLRRSLTCCWTFLLATRHHGLLAHRRKTGRWWSCAMRCLVPLAKQFHTNYLFVRSHPVIGPFFNQSQSPRGRFLSKACLDIICFWLQPGY